MEQWGRGRIFKLYLITCIYDKCSMFEIKIHNGYLLTLGFKKVNKYELSIVYDGKRPIERYNSLLLYIYEYLSNEKRQINNEETVAYGIWALKFIYNENTDSLEIYELDINAEFFIRGAEFSIKIWDEQYFVCEQYKVKFTPPTIDQMITISDGVYEGALMEGIRYHSPSHMSGWFLTTDLYNNDINSLKPVHVFHILKMRPDITKYLALPFGFVFQQNTNLVWLDKEVANDFSAMS